MNICPTLSAPRAFAGWTASALACAGLWAALPGLARAQQGAQLGAQLGARTNAQAAAVLAALPAADLARGLALARQAAKARAPAAARIEVQLGAVDPRLKLAPCRRAEPFLPPGVAPWGPSRVGLRCQEGTVAWTVFLPVTVGVFAATLAPRTGLSAGTVLTEADLAPVQANWAAGPLPPLATAAELVGRTLARAVNPGQTLYNSDLRRRQWFASGDKVRVLATGNGFAIATEGQALNDGVEGQRVRVQVLVRGEDGQSGRGPILTGRPTADRQVEVAAL